MDELVANWMLRVAGLIYLLLFGSITIWGVRKVDDTMTAYLWKLIRVFKKMKGRV